MTKKEAIHTTKKLFKEVNADSLLFDKLVYSLLQKHLKWLVNRDSEKLKIRKLQSVFQRKKCVRVIEAPAIDACCGIKSACKIWRTESKLPELFEDSKGVLIKDIYSIDGSNSFFQITPRDLERKLTDPWAKKTIASKQYFFYSDGYLYFPLKSYPLIEVEGYFVDNIVNNCDKKTSKTQCVRYLDTEWVCPDYLQAQVIDFTIKDLQNTYKRIPETSQNIDKNANQ